MSIYELAILGVASPQERTQLTHTIERMVSEYGLTVGKDVVVLDAAGVSSRDKHAAFAAAYFGDIAQIDLDAARESILASAPVIPTIAADGHFDNEIPDFLRAINGIRRRGDDAEMTELAAAMLECVGLLRRQRRVFVRPAYRIPSSSCTAA